MRYSAIYSSLAILWLACLTHPCLAEQDTSGQTLEDLLKAETPAPADEEPAVESKPIKPAPVRPKGTLVRPKDGVEHPDLDKAWAEYDAVVAEIVKEFRAAIKKEFDAAATRGDLDLAEKWDRISKKFESGGELELEGELKMIAKKAAPKLKEAQGTLGKAYEVVVKALTMEKKIAEAKAAKSEFAAASAGDGHSSNGPAGVPRVPPGMRKWKVVVWNSHNSSYKDRGTTRFDVAVAANGKVVFEKKGVDLEWFQDRDSKAEVEFVASRVDALRVSVTGWRGLAGGSLAEVQLIDDGNENVAPKQFEAVASHTEHGHLPLRVIDGDTRSGSSSRWNLPDNTPGWIELRRKP